jgi:hypothetical protein
MTVIAYRPRTLVVPAPTTADGVRVDHVFVCADGPWFCAECGEAARLDNLEAVCPEALRRHGVVA